jgi:Effector-associated domain 7
MSYEQKAIRQLLMAAFTEDDLRAFCFDNFPEVHATFTAGQTLTDRVILLIQHADSHGCLADLLKKIEAVRPAKFEEFKSRLKLTQAVGNEPLRGGKCYLITPRTNRRRSNRLYQVLEPVLREQLQQALEQAEYDESGTNFERLANADLIIADVTNKDPGVMYEIAVAQCLGQPVFVVGDNRALARYEDLPFNVITLDLGNDEDIRDLVPDEILKIKRACQTLGTNPIVKAFNAPLTELSPSSGLVLGYYENFVQPVARSICEVVLGINPWKIEVAQLELRDTEWKEIRLDIILPKNLDWASNDFILEHLIKPGVIRSARIKANPRDRTLYALPEIRPDQCVHLADPFPTFMKVLEKALDDRFDTRRPAERGPQWHNAAEWEIEIVRRRLHTLIQRRSEALDSVQGNRTLHTKSVIQVLRWNEVFPDLEENLRK